jgi:periplasmic divalent cation tolerance protein
MAVKTPGAGVVFVMAGGDEEAEKIARALVDEKLAACANIIGPVRSIYRWRGAVEGAREYLIMIKTRISSFRRIERRVRELHSYEVPEVIALRVAAGSRPYLDWIAQNSDRRTTSSLRTSPR